MSPFLDYGIYISKLHHFFTELDCFPLVSVLYFKFGRGQHHIRHLTGNADWPVDIVCIRRRRSQDRICVAFGINHTDRQSTLCTGSAAGLMSFPLCASRHKAPQINEFSLYHFIFGISRDRDTSGSDCE